jgi:hypothetical protein
MCLDHRVSARVSQLVSVHSSQRYLTPFAIRSISSWQWWQTGHSGYSLLAVLTGSFGWVIDVLNLCFNRLRKLYCWEGCCTYLVYLRGLKFRLNFLRGRTQQHRVELWSGISLNSSTRLSGFFSAIGFSHLASSGSFFCQTWLVSVVTVRIMDMVVLGSSLSFRQR